MSTEQLKQDSSTIGNKEHSLYLDYSLQSCGERTEYVRKLLEEHPEKAQSLSFLERLGDYIINAASKIEKKQHLFLTDNRMVTIQKRETSFEGILDKLEFEDSIYSIIEDNKQAILTPKYCITKKDLEEIPLLKQLVDEIKKIEELERHSSGIRKYGLKRWLIEMRRDQYIIKDGYKTPQRFQKISHNVMEKNIIDEEAVITISADGRVSSNEQISLFNPQHVSLLLHYYSDLKQDAWGNFNKDLWYLMEMLDDLVEAALPHEYPLLYDLLIMKIDGKTNTEIGVEISKIYDKHYTNEYLSALWRKKIPKLIAETAEKQYLDWYYTEKEIGKWKKCSKCGQVKLAHSFYFSKNKSSKDGFYSICKVCRNAKNRIKKEVSK